MMEYEIDADDQKRVQVQSIDEELVLILSQGDTDIFMSCEMYCNLKKHTDRLSQALVRICLCQDDVDYSVPLGNDIFAYAKSPFRCIQIRQFHEHDAVMLPTRQGLSLKRKQWSTLLDIFKTIDEDFATPKQKRCQELHQNQEAFFDCPDCYCPPEGRTPRRKSKKRTGDAAPLKKRLFDD